VVRPAARLAFRIVIEVPSGRRWGRATDATIAPGEAAVIGTRPRIAAPKLRGLHGGHGLYGDGTMRP
jgi:hypothetical protein